MRCHTLSLPLCPPDAPRPSRTRTDDQVRAPSASRAFTSKRPSRPAIGAKKRPKNSALAVGYKEDLSFVVQGDMIGVFKQQREGGKKVRLVPKLRLSRAVVLRDGWADMVLVDGCSSSL